MNLKQTFVLLLFSACLSPSVAVSSKVPDGGTIEVNVFFDTRGIDVNHLRQEVKHVNFTRTSESCNVHLLNTLERTGGNGRQYAFYFIGLQEFRGINEDLMRQTFAIAYKVQEKWGSAYTSLSAKTYFHDFAKNSFNIYSGLYLRVWKGLSLNVSGNYSIINDRLSIGKK